MDYKNLRGKTFILGVGAQKSGTSWLHHYLLHHPSVKMSAIKEVHFWDQKFRGDLCHSFKEQFQNNLRSAVSREENFQTSLGLDEISYWVDMVRMGHQDRAYFEYFDRLAIGEQSHIGEITPSYSLIRKEGWEEIKKNFLSQDIQLKIVFLMRNPVERYYSALRMFEQKQLISSATQSFLAELDNPQHIERTRYDLTIESLLSVFGKDEIYFGFYETMFNSGTIENLCHFLDLAYIPAKFDEKVNASSSTRSLSPHEIAQALNRFSVTYEYCQEFFGNKLPQDWRDTYALS